MKNVLRIGGILIAACAAAAAHADIVQNGGFNPAAGGGATAWTFTGAINNIYAFDNADVVAGVSGLNGLWSDANGGTGTLSAPYAGAKYFYGQDAGVYPNWATTTLVNLTVGAQYTLSFHYAAGQMTPYTTGEAGATVGWDYYVGQFNPAWSNGCGVVDCPAGPNLGSVNSAFAPAAFSGWSKETATFVATATTETLGFLATTNAGDVPPMALLAGVDVTGPGVLAAPEPATWAELMIGFAAVGGLVYRSRRGARAVAA